MSLERNNRNRNVQNLYDECNKLMGYHIMLTMKDGSVFDGIIESVEPDRVIVLVGEDVMEDEFENQYNQQRQFGRPRRFRRFRRRAFPFSSLIGLSLLPFAFFPPFFPIF